MRSGDDDQCPRIVVNAIPMGTAGNREFRMLEHAGVIRHQAEMCQVDLRQSLLVPTQRADCRDIYACAQTTGFGVGKNLQIAPAHLLHHHGSGVRIGCTAQCKTILGVIQQLIDLIR